MPLWHYAGLLLPCGPYPNALCTALYCSVLSLGPHWPRKVVLTCDDIHPRDWSLASLNVEKECCCCTTVISRDRIPKQRKPVHAPIPRPVGLYLAMRCTVAVTSTAAGAVCAFTNNSTFHPPPSFHLPCALVGYNVHRGTCSK